MRSFVRRCLHVWMPVGWIVLGSAGTTLGARASAAQSAHNSSAQRTSTAGDDSSGLARVTLRVRDSTVEYVIQTLARQAHLRTVFNVDDHAVLKKRVVVNVKNANVIDAMSVALRGTGLVAKLTPTGEAVMIVDADARDSERERAGSGSITGRVTDSATGRGVRGATVKVVGTELGTTTMEDGRFTVRGIPAGEYVLTVRLFGYRPAQRPVTVTDSAQAALHIALVSAPTLLSGVVTTATGVQQRERVGNDIVVLNADSIQRVAPVSSLTDLLETRVPGLTVMHTSGVPGAPSRLRLRGVSSPGRSNDPILIVDGVRMYANQSEAPQSLLRFNGDAARDYPPPSPFDQIDPNSIETIEVFKGPSASALYGADAGNGAIVVTTKRGRSGQTRWGVSATQGWSSMPGGGFPVTYFRFGHPYNGSPTLCRILDATCLTDSVVPYQALNDPNLSPIGHGSNHEGSVNVSGGNNTLAYSLTGSVSDAHGVLRLPSLASRQFEDTHGFATPGWMQRPDRMTSYGATSKVNVGIGRDGMAEFSNSIYRSDQQQSSLQSLLGYLQTQYIDTTGAPFSASSTSGIYTRVRNAKWTTNNALSLDIPLRSWLPLHGTFGINYMNGTNTLLEPRNYNPADTLGRYGLSNETDLEGTAKLSTTLRIPGASRRPGVVTAVGFDFTKETRNGFDGEADALVVGDFHPTSFDCNQRAPTSTAISICAQERGQSQSTYGWFLEPTVELGQRLFVSPGLRLDGGSASGANAGVQPFPKISVSWVAVQAGDAPLFGVISSLRPRLALGIAGVQPAPGDKLRLYSSGVVRDASGALITVTRLTAFGNTQLRPERSRELEGGFDVELWDSRVTMNVTPYYKMRYDAITQVTLPASAGSAGCAGALCNDGEFGSLSLNGVIIEQNIGNVRNVGVDASMTVRLLNRVQTGWDITAGVHKDNNKVTRLAAGFAQSKASGIVAGYPLFGVWERPLTGYADANGDGHIDGSEIAIGDSAVYLGESDPNYQLSFSTNFSFFDRRLSLNTAGDYQNGMTQTLADFAGTPFLSTYYALGTPLSQQAAIAASRGPNATQYGLIQTVNVLRWTTLSLSYVLPTSVARRFRAPLMSVALQGRNLALKSNYHGKDPSVNAYATGNFTRDSGQLPLPRIWQLRFSIGN